MAQDIVLSGLGGQGIRTMGRVLAVTALGRGQLVVHAEVHGRPQRPQAVLSHVRVSHEELLSNLIAPGQANVLLGLEPFEALRHLEILREDGVLVCNTAAVVNMENYPPIEELLGRVTSHPNHVVLDMEKLARAAGSVRTVNMVALGAGSPFMNDEPGALEAAVEELFAERGAEVVEINKRALRFGRNAALAYREGLRRGVSSRGVRQWIDTLGAAHLAAEAAPRPDGLEAVETRDRLSGAEAHAFERALVRAHEEGRRQLFEHEVYTLVEVVGAITPPRHVFVPHGTGLPEGALARFPGEQVVLKLVSPDVVHKSDVGAVQFVPKDAETVQQEIERMTARHAKADIAGVLVIEFVEQQHRGFGSELFVGIRATREFGPVIAAGLGGVDTEYLATKMKPGIAVAKAAAQDTSAEEFFELFQQTAAYDVLAGRARGHRRIVADNELLRCFRAFISIARRFCVDRGEEGPDIAELEVNPFAFRDQRLVPLDGRGRMKTAVKTPAPRPLEKVPGLLQPNTIGVLGVSAKSMNYGRIILANVIRCGFPKDKIRIIKDDADEIDGVRCVASFEALDVPIDLLVMAPPAAALPKLVEDINASAKVQTAIMISGGVGETEGTEEIEAALREALHVGRQRPDGGTVFIGPNCLGVQSRPGRYDTFFIPDSKLDQRWTAPPRRVAMISQSGAFIISRLSNLAPLDPAIAVSIGNQMDLTVSDLLRAVGERDDIDAIGVYVEGFADLDGLAFLRAVEDLTAAGKVVIFYKAGRTEKGRSAAAGHTASVAGDYDVATAAASHAGAIVVETFAEFECLLELASTLHHKPIRGQRVFAVTNAGMEAVGMADNIRGERYEIRMDPPSDELRGRLIEVLARHKLDKLANARNPLDLTAMGAEAAYQDIARLMMESDEYDAIVVAAIPLAPLILGTPEDVKKPESLSQRVPQLFAASPKPVVFVVDSGPLYDEMANSVRVQGVPTFRSADQAVRCLGLYMTHRVRMERR